MNDVILFGPAIKNPIDDGLNIPSGLGLHQFRTSTEGMLLCWPITSVRRLVSFGPPPEIIKPFSFVTLLRVYYSFIQLSTSLNIRFKSVADMNRGRFPTLLEEEHEKYCSPFGFRLNIKVNRLLSGWDTFHEVKSDINLYLSVETILLIQRLLHNWWNLTLIRERKTK